ncbi:DNA alkylation repair protein [Paenibacillus silvisoli]|uniref:DNA alkylation repair protein n=1 Tax=Paenibacillus silvisoli TaxID=3110539 RepID=UPI00280406B5|nr:DNA alkylation repair protein [Paenibacillus silvisoli]
MSVEMRQHTYTSELESVLRAHANRELAESMEAYMRHLFPFLGIRTPERNALVKQFMKEHGVPAGEELEAVVRELWSKPEREFHYAAMMLLEKRKKDADAGQVGLLEELITTHSWWDTVDLLASHQVGNVFTRYPELVSVYTEKWIASEDMWLRRTAILYQLGYKGRTDAELLFSLIRRTAHETEFFIRKAIGWALREYAKTDAAAVQRFVAETELSPLSVREALKHVGAGDEPAE